MNSLLSGFKFSVFNATHWQITEQLREKILNGDLKPGTQLPNIRELGVIWGVSTFTIHTAIKPLIKTGLLVTRRKLGTFVAERKKKLTCAAIYFGCKFWDRPAMEFGRHMYLAVRDELNEHAIKTRLWIRSDDDDNDVYDFIDQAIENNEVQCLVPLGIGGIDEVERFSKAKVPTVMITGEPIMSRVYVDYRQFFRISLEELRLKGCRTVGLVTPMLASFQNKVCEAFYEDFFSMVKSFGMTFRNEWIIAPRKGATSDAHEEFARENFAKLQTAKDLPDGFIVHTDLMSKGVIHAVEKSDNSALSKIHYVFQVNEGIEIPCPFEAIKVVLNPKDLAKAMVQQIQVQFEGKRVEPILVPYSIRK